MAEANEPTQVSGAEGGDGANQEPPVDYKALYEAEKKHSREWEKKAKANRTAAAALEEANNANTRSPTSRRGSTTRRRKRSGRRSRPRSRRRRACRRA